MVRIITPGSAPRFEQLQNIPSSLPRNGISSLSIVLSSSTIRKHAISAICVYLNRMSSLAGPSPAYDRYWR
jgi:hypothetical protein